MSLNQRGKIVAQVLHPRVATSDRGKSKRSPTARPRPPVPPQDIIEISSDEDENLTLQAKRPFVNHDSQLSEKQEIEKLKKREKELEQVIAMQKEEIEALEEELTCDVCALRMWTPYRLTECGHVFCIGCLLTWLDDVHARFLNSHPGYTPLPPQLKAALRRPLEFPRECAKAYTHTSRFPGPQYTCPSCRAAITRTPIEDFKVKALVSLLGSAQGIEPPESRIPPGKGDTMFDGYSLL